MIVKLSRAAFAVICLVSILLWPKTILPGLACLYVTAYLYRQREHMAALIDHFLDCFRLKTRESEAAPCLSKQALFGDALHEAGHVVVAWFTPYAPKVLSVMVFGVRESSTRGQTAFEKHESPDARTLAADLAIGYGARAAEERFLGSATQGCRGDIERVTEIATVMVCALGYGKAMGVMAYDLQLTSPDMTDKIHADIRALLDDAYATAKTCVDRNSENVEKLAHALASRMELSRDDIREILGEPTNSP